MNISNNETLFPPYKASPGANPFLVWLGKIGLGLFGWRPGGSLPDADRFVIIGAPHTSNWDLLLGFGLMLVMNKKIFWMAKDSIFWPPLGWFFKWAGGIPVDRSKRHNWVAKGVEMLKTQEGCIIGITPEGTRSRVPYWKSGFYHMAYQAQVPIVLCYLDYGRKVIGIGPVITPSGDLEADTKIFREFYAQVTAKYPDQFGEIKFRPQSKA